MEAVEDVVIVGSGIAGLATALGLYRIGIRSLVLESSDRLRTTGYAFVTWKNAWKALDALGIGDALRSSHLQLTRLRVASRVTGLTASEVLFMDNEKGKNFEVRCLRRTLLLETLERELPHGTIRFGSKVVSLEKSGNLQLLHLADGSTMKTKVLIGSDGVNSIIAKSLGLGTPAFAGRSAVRGIAELPEGHNLKPEFLQNVGDGLRSGFVPCDDKTVYWFFTYIPSPHNKKFEGDAEEMKQYILSKLGAVPKQILAIVEASELETMVPYPLSYRRPWELLWGSICKDNVCVTGDAFHPMTPDLGQGACSALEDGVTMARCLGEALLGKGGNEATRIKSGLEKFAKERRWRSINLITTAYVTGLIQQSDDRVVSFLRDKFLAGVLAGNLLRSADFDCGNLYKTR
ncbi:hypothetical protein H6P81_018655 [Aristolochia fimbriata]|uniref:FAD-binding domain-containing protein n=1 Tax=Aristolochia fimbriata TaxID=158543 RepID=A0AAV7E4W6_ARIFI|nr:hypothetical protein H6P81_018655 [Aristolochia fimbriata]